MMKADPRQYRVIEAYQSPYPEPILFQVGEQVETGEQFSEDPDWQNWVWCTGKEGQRAWVPLQYLTITDEKGVFKTSYNALELSVNLGEVLTVYEEINGFGMAEKADGSKGWVPLRNMTLEKSM
jgi:hypothetical protein